MAGVNKVILVGRLGRDPEIRNFQNGGRVVNLRLATSERFKDREGNQQERTEWHSVAIFNEKLGEIAEKYLRKGSEVYVEGQLETRKWQDQAGADRYTTEIVLRQFRGEIALLGGRGTGGEMGGDPGEGGGGYAGAGGGGVVWRRLWRRGGGGRSPALAAAGLRRWDHSGAQPRTGPGGAARRRRAGSDWITISLSDRLPLPPWQGRGKRGFFMSVQRPFPREHGPAHPRHFAPTRGWSRPWMDGDDVGCFDPKGGAGNDRFLAWRATGNVRRVHRPGRGQQRRHGSRDDLIFGAAAAIRFRRRGNDYSAAGRRRRAARE